MTAGVRQTAVALLPAAVLVACATYVPPGPASPQAVSRELMVPYDMARSAAMQVAAAGFAPTDPGARPDGSIRVGIRSNDPAGYVDCGVISHGSDRPPTPALLGLGFDAAVLQGTADIGIAARGAHAAEVRVNGQYTLGVYRIDPIGTRIRIAEFRFDSTSADTSRIGLRFVTCRSSQAIEREILDLVAARS